MTILIDNQQARRAFLERQGLSRAPNLKLGKAGLLGLIEDLGFIQVDSIRTVERAHHQILFSRNQTFRREDLVALLETDGALFEHWTHDAAIIPSIFFRYWKHRFLREEAAIIERWQKWRGEGFDAVFDETYTRVKEGGPVMARDIRHEDHKSGGWWNWHPSKTALEYHWRTGRFAIAGRVNFQKVYDLTERVLPAHHHEPEVSHAEFVDWACRAALSRLGFATSGEIAAFFDLVTPQEAKDWLAAEAENLQPVEIVTVDGRRRLSYALPEMVPALADPPEPPARIRVLSPFDPLLRDRDRAERLFGFNYRIEIFVPEPKRQFGYYVFPLLEGDRLIGRIDMKADRKAGVLDVKRLWLEKGVRASAGRLEKLDAELQRLSRFTGVERINYMSDWHG